MFKDVKTTVTAIVGIAAFVINKVFGIGIPENELVVVFVFLIGVLAGDSKSSED